MLFAWLNYIRSDMQVAPSEPSAFPTVPYDEVMASDEGVREWTQKIVRL